MKVKKRMSKKTKVIIAAAVLIAWFLISAFVGTWKKGTVTEFVDDAVIIKSKGGKEVTLVEDYRDYIPKGEQWAVGDRVIIRHSLFCGLSIHRLAQ